MVGITVKSELLIGFGIVIWIMFRGIVGICRKKFAFKKECVYFLFLVYMLCVIGVTLFPIEVIWNEEYRLHSSININLNPLQMFENVKLVGIGVALKNILGNLALFVPLSIFFNMRFKNTKYRHMLAVGILLSLMIELGQLLEMYFEMTNVRVVDINDVILNACGMLVGKFVYDYAIKGIVDKKIKNCSIFSIEYGSLCSGVGILQTDEQREKHE